MDSKNILTLFGLNYECINVTQEIIENDKEYVIYAEALIDFDRNCPKCGQKGQVKEKICVTENITLSKFNHKSLVLNLTKRRFKCPSCNITRTQRLPFIEKKRSIANNVLWSIYDYCKKVITFSDISKKYDVSLTTVINVFDKFCDEKALPLRICICIDEFYFKVTRFNKFPAVLSDAKSGRILDIIPSRKKEYLNSYFSKKSKIERETVKFFACDLNETYRSIAKRWLPNAIVIADFFHVTKLIVKLVDDKRIKFMKSLDKTSVEYKFVKKYRKFFLASNKKLLQQNIYFKDDRNNEIHISEMLFSLVKKNSELLEIYLIYRDYNYLMTEKKGSDIKTLEHNLEFIINKCLKSTHEDVVTLGETLLSWSTEVLNAYSDKNIYEISNGIAESNNNRIEKIIKIGNGYRNFERLKKRVLLMERHNKSENQ